MRASSQSSGAVETNKNLLSKGFCLRNVDCAAEMNVIREAGRSELLAAAAASGFSGAIKLQ